MKKTPSHFTARVEIEQQISFFSFGFARVSEVRHIYSSKTVLSLWLAWGTSVFAMWHMITGGGDMVTL